MSHRHYRFASSISACDFVELNRDLIKEWGHDEFARFVSSLLKYNHIAAIESLDARPAISAHASEPLQEALTLIISNDDPEALSAMLSLGIDADSLIGDMHLLTYAASIGSTECVMVLLQQGASPNLTGSDGWTALHWASQECRIEIIDELIRYGCDLIPINEDGDSPIWVATGEGHYKLVEKFIDLGIDANTHHPDTTWNRYSLLMFAALYDRTKVVEVLLQRGADSAYVAQDGKNALTVAQEYAGDEIVALLCEENSG